MVWVAVARMVWGVVAVVWVRVDLVVVADEAVDEVVAAVVREAAPTTGLAHHATTPIIIGAKPATDAKDHDLMAAVRLALQGEEKAVLLRR